MKKELKTGAEETPLHAANPALLLGTAYYPEQDPESEWGSDARLMRELGIDFVRMGEFCWSRMQQANGTFTLEWLERCIALFHEQGIQTVLCTPSACPPAWLMTRYPDLPCITPDGRVGMFGGRRHYSVFHSGYRQAAQAMADALARRFGRHPAVAGWQIDNEVGSYYTVDCSAPALAAFHQWLERRYGDVAELNRRWGLIFWNQEVESFADIPAPTEMMCTRNPSYLLDYNRFCLEGMSDFLLGQAEVIRHSASSRQFVVASAVEPVLRALKRQQQEREIVWVDEVSMHNYPELYPAPGETAMHLDRFRSLASSSRFLVMEQQIGSGRTTTGGLDPAIRRYWTLQAVAHGAKAVCWFHWRRFRTGCEWRLSSIIERDRQPRAIYGDIGTLIGELRAVAPLLQEGRVCPDAQILMSADNILAFDRSSEATFWMAIQLPDATAHRFPLWERATRRGLYNPLAHSGWTPAFVTESDDWDTALPLFMPDLDICSPELVQKLTDFCRRGGTVICFPGAGERDENGAHREAPPPGILGPLFGVALLDYLPVSAQQGAVFDHVQGREQDDAAAQDEHPVVAARLGEVALRLDARHAEALAVTDADVVARYAQGRFDGAAAMTSRGIGKGRAIYLGAWPADEESAASLYATLLPHAACALAPAHCIRWVSPHGAFAFLTNGTPQAIPLPAPLQDIITAAQLTELPPWSVVLTKTDDA